ncbi:hypothetical protein VNO77_27583 [Canavalia gladiata]|uniref:Glycosyltransferase n=1 Tax=Canavalia gladiata TaxID=3824 RepID=A0AAN9Q771_CANGL
MEAKHEPLKIYFLPFMALGHMIPMVKLARVVASRGEHVTIITTPSNAKLFSKLIDQDRATLGSHIIIHTINFPSKEVGLPEGLENMSSATDNDGAAKICTAANLLQQQVEAFVESNPPHVIITDMMFTWSGQLTSCKGIPRLVFSPLSIFDACITLAIAKLNVSSNSGSAFTVPGLPHAITLTVMPSLGFIRFTQKILDAMENSLGVIVECFLELEAEYAEHYEKLTGRKVWHVGPASLMLNNHMKDVNSELNDMREDIVECLNWLDEQQNESVVYISFGSLCRFPDEQLSEIACGIEASGHKFVWVVRKEDNDDDNEWLPRGFEERMREEKRGKVVKGWVPQVRILNHPAIGAFLTQCGLNAMLEAIGCGVPMITMPGFGDQYYHEKHITQVCGFGVEVGAQEWTVSPYGGSKSVVRRERIEDAVKRLMNSESEEGVRVRRQAKELREKALEAVKEGGSSHTNLTTMIRDIKHLVFNDGKRNNFV